MAYPTKTLLAVLAVVLVSAATATTKSATATTSDLAQVQAGDTNAQALEITERASAAVKRARRRRRIAARKALRIRNAAENAFCNAEAVAAKCGLADECSAEEKAVAGYACTAQDYPGCSNLVVPEGKDTAYVAYLETVMASGTCFGSCLVHTACESGEYPEDPIWLAKCSMTSASYSECVDAAVLTRGSTCSDEVVAAKCGILDDCSAAEKAVAGYACTDEDHLGCSSLVKPVGKDSAYVAYLETVMSSETCFGSCLVYTACKSGEYPNDPIWLMKCAMSEPVMDECVESGTMEVVP